MLTKMTVTVEKDERPERGEMRALKVDRALWDAMGLPGDRAVLVRAREGEEPQVVEATGDGDREDGQEV